MNNRGKVWSLGFTLIELLVALAMGAVFLTLAVPAMRDYVDSMRLRSGINTLLSSVHLARSEAIKRGARVVLCKSANGAQCADTGGWEQGWILFHDVNNDADLNNGETLLWSEQALSSRVLLSGNSPISSYVSYTSIGIAKFTSGGFQAGTFTLCTPSSTPVQARQIVINSAGRPRTTKVMVDHCPL
jgi:type IV fimbrial biogenesis protein FimT